MNLKLLLILPVILLLSTQNFAQKNQKQIEAAIEFNDYCASITDSLFYYGTIWGEKFTDVFPSKTFNKLSKHSSDLIVFIERKQKELVNKKIEKDWEDLRLATLDFLSFEKQLIHNVFVPIEKLSVHDTDETIELALNKLEEDIKKEEVALKKVEIAQKNLAKIYGYTIENVE